VLLLRRRRSPNLASPAQLGPTTALHLRRPRGSKRRSCSADSAESSIAPCNPYYRKSVCNTQRPLKDGPIQTYCTRPRFSGGVVPRVLQLIHAHFCCIWCMHTSRYASSNLVPHSGQNVVLSATSATPAADTSAARLVGVKKRHYRA